VALSGDVTLLAFFDTTFTLNTGVSGPGAMYGEILASDYRCDCSAGACSCRVLSGNSITLTANQTAAGLFSGWSGDCSGTARICTLTMSGDRSVTASFQVSNVLTVGTSSLTPWINPGTLSRVGSTPAGISVRANSTATGYFGSGSVQLTPINQESPHFFNHWEGACTGSADPCVVAFPGTGGSATVYAIFD
jgi:hypothetical protein